MAKAIRAVPASPHFLHFASRAAVDAIAELIAQQFTLSAIVFKLLRQFGPFHRMETLFRGSPPVRSLEGDDTLPCLPLQLELLLELGHIVIRGFFMEPPILNSDAARTGPEICQPGASEVPVIPDALIIQLKASKQIVEPLLFFLKGLEVSWRAEAAWRQRSGQVAHVLYAGPLGSRTERFLEHFQSAQRRKKSLVGNSGGSARHYFRIQRLREVFEK